MQSFVSRGEKFRRTFLIFKVASSIRSLTEGLSYFRDEYAKIVASNVIGSSLIESPVERYNTADRQRNRTASQGLTAFQVHSGMPRTSRHINQPANLDRLSREITRDSRVMRERIGRDRVLGTVDRLITAAR